MTKFLSKEEQKIYKEIRLRAYEELKITPPRPPAIDAPPTTVEEIEKQSKKGYLSLIAQLRSLYLAQEHLKSHGNRLSCDPGNIYREWIKESVAQSLRGCHTAMNLHTRATYWELRETGLNHPRAYDEVNNIIIVSVKESGFHRQSRGDIVPVHAILEYPEPSSVLLIEGEDAATGGHATGKRTREKLERNIKEPEQLTKELGALIQEQLGIKPTFVRGTIRYDFNGNGR